MNKRIRKKQIRCAAARQDDGKVKVTITIDAETFVKAVLSAIRDNHASSQH